MPIRHYTIKNQNAVFNESETSTIPNLWNFDNDYKHIVINAGFHGNEKSSVWALSLLTEEIVRCNDSWAKYIKSNAIIDIIPIACPWNFDNFSRKNINGIDCCFDFVGLLSSESKAIKSFIEKISSRCIAVIDSHNNPSDKCRTCFFEQRSTDKFFMIQNRLCAQLSAALFDDWKQFFPNTEAPFLHMVSGKLKTSFSWFFAQKGMYGLTVETPCNFEGGPRCVSNVCKLTKDIVCNLIISFIGIYF